MEYFNIVLLSLGTKAQYEYRHIIDHFMFKIIIVGFEAKSNFRMSLFLSSVS